MNHTLDDVWREAEKIVSAHPDPSARRWFETFSTMDALIRRIAATPLVENDPTARKLLEGFEHCATIEDIAARIDLLTDHVDSLVRAKLIADGKDPGPAKRSASRRSAGSADSPADDEDDHVRRTVLRL